MHRAIIDSVHHADIGYQSIIFKEMLVSRANALLMDETTMNFYQQNLRVTPDDISHYGISYLLTILNIVLKHNGTEKYQAISKTVKKAIKDYCPEYMEARSEPNYPKTCEEIVKTFNNLILSEQQNELRSERKLQGVELLLDDGDKEEQKQS